MHGRIIKAGVGHAGVVAEVDFLSHGLGCDGEHVPVKLVQQVREEEQEQHICVVRRDRLVPWTRVFFCNDDVDIE